MKISVFGTECWNARLSSPWPRTTICGSRAVVQFPVAPADVRDGRGPAPG